MIFIPITTQWTHNKLSILPRKKRITKYGCSRTLINRSERGFGFRFFLTELSLFLWLKTTLPLFPLHSRNFLASANDFCSPWDLAVAVSPARRGWYASSSVSWSLSTSSSSLRSTGAAVGLAAGLGTKRRERWRLVWRVLWRNWSRFEIKATRSCLSPSRSGERACHSFEATHWRANIIDVKLGGGGVAQLSCEIRFSSWLTLEYDSLVIQSQVTLFSTLVNFSFTSEFFLWTSNLDFLLLEDVLSFWSA